MDLEPYRPPSLNIIHCVTVKLTEENFFFWKRQFQSFLSGQRLYGFVTGSEIQPSETLMAPTISGVSTPIPNPDHPLWFKKTKLSKRGFLVPSPTPFNTWLCTAQQPRRSGAPSKSTSTNPQTPGCLSFNTRCRRSQRQIKPWLSIFRRSRPSVINSLPLALR